MRLDTDRALADALGGMDGGWHFWRAALAALEDAIERSRERRDAFCSYPEGEFRRFVVALDDALGLAATAVEVQQAINAEPDGKGLERRETIAELLEARVRSVRRRRHEEDRRT